MNGGLSDDEATMAAAMASLRDGKSDVKVGQHEWATHAHTYMRVCMFGENQGE